MSPIFGVVRAVVVDNQDPENRGRVKVRLAQGTGPGRGEPEAWAALATPAPRGARGAWLLPEVKDVVLVAFEGGDPGRPCVLGSLWSPSDAPLDAPGADGGRIVIRSRSGVTITLSGGDGPGAVEVADGNGNSVALGTDGVTVRAAARVSVAASVVEVDAGLVNVNAGISRFSGTVQCDTLIANGVVSASYSPGAGNVW